MWVMKYECEGIKNMKWIESYVIFINLEQKNAPTLLFQKIFDFIKETMNEGDEVWKWVHKNYEMSQIIRKFN